MNRYLWEKRLRGCMAVLTLREHSVLMMLATYADSSGRGARPAMSSLADDCGASRETVKRTLKSLVAKGYLTVDGDRLGGRNRPTRYDLVWSMPHCQEGDKGGHPDDPLYPRKGGHLGDPLSGSIPSERGSNGPPKGGQSFDPRSGKKSGKDKRPPAASSTYVGQCECERETRAASTEWYVGQCECERETRAASTEWSDGTPIGNPPDDLDAPPSRALTVVPDLDPPTEIDTHPAPRRRADITPSAATLVRYTLPPGLPREFITETEQIVTRQARAGIDTDAIRAAVEKLGRRPGASPKLLPNLIADEVRARAAPAATETKATARARQTIADGQALINQLRAEGKLT